MADDASPDIRLSDAERDQVIKQLNVATQEGRLDLSEFEERSKWVYAAKVRGDLDGVLAGLPLAAAGEAGLAPVATESNTNRSWFFGLLGDQTRRGNLDLGKKATSISLIGDTTFDLSAVTARTVNLTVVQLIGDVTVLVAPGTQVDAGGLVILGDRTDLRTGPPPADAMRVRFRAWGLIGDVAVRVVNPPA